MGYLLVEPGRGTHYMNVGVGIEAVEYASGSDLVEDTIMKLLAIELISKMRNTNVIVGAALEKAKGDSMLSHLTTPNN